MSLQKTFRAIVDNKATVPLVFGIPIAIFVIIGVLIYFALLQRSECNIVFINDSNANIAQLSCTVRAKKYDLGKLAAHEKRLLKFTATNDASLAVRAQYDAGKAIYADNMLYCGFGMGIDGAITITPEKIECKKL